MGYLNINGAHIPMATATIIGDHEVIGSPSIAAAATAAAAASRPAGDNTNANTNTKAMAVEKASTVTAGMDAAVAPAGGEEEKVNGGTVASDEGVSGDDEMAALLARLNALR